MIRLQVRLPGPFVWTPARRRHRTGHRTFTALLVAWVIAMLIVNWLITTIVIGGAAIIWTVFWICVWRSER